MLYVFTILTIYLVTMGRNSLEFIRDCPNIRDDDDDDDKEVSLDGHF